MRWPAVRSSHLSYIDLGLSADPLSTRTRIQLGLGAFTRIRMADQKVSSAALCPECDELVQLNRNTHIGQKLSCRHCRSTLVIVDLKPLELVLAAGQRPEKAHTKGVGKGAKESAAAQSLRGQIVKPKEELPVSTGSPASMADCPECNSRLRFHKSLKIGQLMVCPECDETLEVASLRPLELDWAEEEPRDSEEYDDPQYRSRSEIN